METKIIKDLPWLSPMLAPSELLDTDIPLDTVGFPLLCSTKYNGVRCILINGIFRSRSGKLLRIPDELMKALAPLATLSRERGIVFDGEFHADSQNTVGQTMSALAGTAILPDDFCYKIFYSMSGVQWLAPQQSCMEDILAQNCPIPYSPRIKIVRQTLISSKESFRSIINMEKFSSLEGFILINPTASYKHGRCTIKEGTMFKYKYYGDEEDATIVGITSRRERKADIPVGKCYTQDSFQDTDIGGCLIVQLDKTEEIINCPFPLDFYLSSRKIAFNRFGTGLPGDLKGKAVCFKRLSVEDRGKPVAIKQVQFRDNK